MQKVISLKNRISKKTTIFTILAVFFVILDRFLKVLCSKGLLDKPFPLFGDILGLHFAKNYYISFSIPLSGPILTTAIGIIILILLVYLIKTFKTQLSLLILIIGATINFIDRLKFGYVIDYFDLKWFAVFNIADCFIVLGIFFLLIKQIKK
ncbi:MAG: signal peptidase II [Patescibacteria group bacterium]|jgi:signal peptidase II